MALYNNKKMNDLVARKPFGKGGKYKVDDLLPNRPKGLKGEALRRYIQKRKQQGKKEIISRPVKPGKKWTEKEMANAKPKPMPKPPRGRGSVPRPVPGRPTPIARGQKERVLAKLKQMRENA